MDQETSGRSNGGAMSSAIDSLPLGAKHMKQIVFVFLLAAAACGQRATAETQAAAYLRASFPAARSRTVTCMNQDTDGNGYVSCDSFIDGHAETLRIGDVYTDPNRNRFDPAVAK